MLLCFILLSRPPKAEMRLLRRPFAEQKDVRISTVRIGNLAVCRLWQYIRCVYRIPSQSGKHQRRRRTLYQQEYDDFLSGLVELDQKQPVRVIYCDIPVGVDYTFLHDFASPFSIKIQSSAVSAETIRDNVASAHCTYVYVSDAMVSEAGTLDLLVEEGSFLFNTLYRVDSNNGIITLVVSVGRLRVKCKKYDLSWRKRLCYNAKVDLGRSAFRSAVYAR